MLARFSNVTGEMDAADLERDVRGFALKAYTEEGNWDFVGYNTPIFFIRDPYKLPDFIQTQKRHPRTNRRSPTAMWDWWSLSPESLHQVTYLMGDRGLPRSLRLMNGYGSHTYSFINAQRAAHYDHCDGNDEYQQAGDLFRLSGTGAQQRLFNNIAEAMRGVPIEIVERQLGHFAMADRRYAEGVARALRITYHPPKG